MVLTARGRQRKGRQFELWTLKKLWAAVGRPWPWKHQRPDDGHSSPEEFYEYHLEMKRQERMNLHEAVKQAREEARRSKKSRWVVISRRSQETPVATVDFYDWMQLVTFKADAEKGKV